MVLRKYKPNFCLHRNNHEIVIIYISVCESTSKQIYLVHNLFIYFSQIKVLHDFFVGMN